MTIYTSRHRAWQATNTADKIAALFTPAIRERFWAKVKRGRDGECWPWQGDASGVACYRCPRCDTLLATAAADCWKCGAAVERQPPKERTDFQRFVDDELPELLPPGSE